jgi:hypothetical protein
LAGNQGIQEIAPAVLTKEFTLFSVSLQILILWIMMPLSEIFLLAIVFYLLYRFVFHFLLPIVRTTRHVREQFRNMQGGPNNMRGGPNQQQQPHTRTQTPPQEPSPTERHSSPHGRPEDYIEFEEVK